MGLVGADVAHLNAAAAAMAPITSTVNGQATAIRSAGSLAAGAAGEMPASAGRSPRWQGRWRPAGDTGTVVGHLKNAVEVSASNVATATTTKWCAGVRPAGWRPGAPEAGRRDFGTLTAITRANSRRSTAGPDALANWRGPVAEQYAVVAETRRGGSLPWSGPVCRPNGARRLCHALEAAQLAVGCFTVRCRQERREHPEPRGKQPERPGVRDGEHAAPGRADLRTGAAGGPDGTGGAMPGHDDDPAVRPGRQKCRRPAEQPQKGDNPVGL